MKGGGEGYWDQELVKFPTPYYYSDFIIVMKINFNFFQEDKFMNVLKCNFFIKIKTLNILWPFLLSKGFQTKKCILSKKGRCTILNKKYDVINTSNHLYNRYSSFRINSNTFRNLGSFPNVGYLGNFPNVWVSGKFPNCLGFWEISKISSHLRNFQNLTNIPPSNTYRHLGNSPNSWIFGKFLIKYLKKIVRGVNELWSKIQT